MQVARLLTRLLSKLKQPKLIYWRLRLVLGLQTAADDEILYRLAVGSRKAYYDFPWGRMDYTARGVLRAQYQEIFVERVYAFQPGTPSPVIVDCGGNIGLSAVWFKQQYPGCALSVYEADPRIAAVLKRNLRRAGYADVAVHQKAVWVADTPITFDCKGDDVGSISSDGGVQVPAVDLAKVLTGHVDLLKLDIEGAEFAVVKHLCDTGAIAHVRNLVAEFHITRERTQEFWTLLLQLEAQGMEVALGSAVASPYIDTASSVSPFAAIGNRNNLVEVYAWRKDGR